jgi:hypothetical protein
MLHIAGHDYTQTDAQRTIGSLGDWWAQSVAGRPAVDGLEALVAEQAAILAAAAGATVTGEGVAAVAIGAAAAGRAVSAGTADAVELVTASLSLLARAGEVFRAAGALGPAASGTLAQISVSDGGVPKLARPEAWIGRRGVEGDRQKTREHHGRPWQAVCLWSADLIDAFVAEGHPLAYGSAGENLTLRGFDWARLRPAVRLRIGEARLEVSMAAVPCNKNRRWFTDGRAELMHDDNGPRSRWYAWVLDEGRVCAGDEVVLEP